LFRTIVMRLCIYSSCTLNKNDFYVCFIQQKNAKKYITSIIWRSLVLSPNHAPSSANMQGGVAGNFWVRKSEKHTKLFLDSGHTQSTLQKDTLHFAVLVLCRGCWNVRSLYGHARLPAAVAGVSYIVLRFASTGSFVLCTVMFPTRQGPEYAAYNHQQQNPASCEWRK